MSSRQEEEEREIWNWHPRSENESAKESAKKSARGMTMWACCCCSSCTIRAVYETILIMKNIQRCPKNSFITMRDEQNSEPRMFKKGEKKASREGGTREERRCGSSSLNRGMMNRTTELSQRHGQERRREGKDGEKRKQRDRPGVILTAPVPKFISTSSSSSTMGRRRSGWKGC